MTASEITQHYNREWDTDAARVILERISGNRSVYAVTDGNGHSANLQHKWVPAGLDFTPAAKCDEDLTECATCSGCAMKVND